MDKCFRTVGDAENGKERTYAASAGSEQSRAAEVEDNVRWITIEDIIHRNAHFVHQLPNFFIDKKFWKKHTVIHDFVYRPFIFQEFQVNKIYS